jgi:hypothetical protein
MEVEPSQEPRSRGHQSALPSRGEVAPTHVGGYEQGLKGPIRVRLLDAEALHEARFWSGVSAE